MHAYSYAQFDVGMQSDWRGQKRYCNFGFEFYDWSLAVALISSHRSKALTVDLLRTKGRTDWESPRPEPAAMVGDPIVLVDKFCWLTGIALITLADWPA